MAIFITLSDLIEVRCYCSATDQTSVNTYHWICSGVTGSGVSDAGAATALETLLAPLFKALIGNTANWDGLTVRLFRLLPRPDAQGSNALFGPGSAGVQLLARQTTGIVSAYTGFAGPGGRGRTYVPFPSTTDNTPPGIPGAGYVTKLTALANGCYGPDTITSGPSSITITPIIWNRHGTTWTNINRTISRAKWATQKRRGSYGRINSSPI